MDISWSTAEGVLINATTYSIENSQLLSRFDLTQSEEQWQVQGEMQGKPVSSVLEHKGELLSDYGSYLVSLELLGSEQDVVTQNMWVAEADPISATAVKMSKIADNEHANVKMDIGTICSRIFS
ncbi:hypothetical protein BI334_33090 [Moorena producens 3L]|nr:hypothetical protein BI334_33090 [Moorena producens 3L]